MRKIISVVVFIFLHYCLYGQTPMTNPCDFDEYIHQHKKVADDFENKIQQFLTTKEDFQRSDSSGFIRIIPVVVHVIHNGGTENISDAQIISQIQVLNEDYRKIPFTNGDGNGVDTEVQFCLANISPNGRCTNGIVRVQSTLTTHQTTQGEQMMALSHWDPTRYLNIYVVKIINGGGILGYASFPGGPPDGDGIVMAHTAFGTLGTAIAPNNLGRTTTHESGHWFGLYHTFNNGCGTDTCTDGDYVCDTPPVASPNFGCPVINSCSNDFPDINDQIENYLDYTNDACKSMFTDGQRSRMHATLMTERFNIWQYSNIWSTGCDSGYTPLPCPAVADFTSNGQTICVGNTVSFINRSLNNCTSYQWYFPGGTPSSSTLVNPTVMYNTLGTYNVELVATNINGTDSVTFVNYISVVTPQVGQPLPFTEGFETPVFPPNGITIDNPDAGITWEKDTVAVQYGGNGSAKINNLINTNYGQADALILPTLDLTSSTTPYLSFRWAYAKSDPSYSDELSVQISTDCGVNFTQIFYRTGASMITGPTQATPYIPDSNTIWKLANINLTAYATSDHATIKVINVTDGGNALYVDNINIDEVSVGVAEIIDPEGNINVYPNPSMGNVTIEFNLLESSNVLLNVYDCVGRDVTSQKWMFSQKGLNKIIIDGSSFQGDGIYYVQLKFENTILRRKIIITR